MIFTRPQWRSWLVRGACIITGYGLVLAAHLAPDARRPHGVADRRSPSPGRSAGGADRRLHRVALRAGEGARPLAEPAAAAAPRWCRRSSPAPRRCCRWRSPSLPRRCRRWRAGWRPAPRSTSLMVAGEMTLPHPTAHARLAAYEMASGRYRVAFRAGVVLVAVALATPWLPRRSPPSRRRGARRSARATSTPTCRPGSPCRWREARTISSERARKRNLLPRPERQPPRRASAEGALGRLGRARLARPGRSGWRSATCSCRPPASTASRRAACSPTSIAETRRDPQVRGQPRASRLARAQLRQGAGDAQPDPRSRPHPLPAASASAGAARGKWERVSWDEALDDIAGAHPQGDRRRAASTR